MARGAARARAPRDAARDRVGASRLPRAVSQALHGRLGKGIHDGHARRGSLALPCGGPITTLTFENVRDHPLQWIWEHSDAFTRFRGDAWMPEPCRSCPRKAQDFGGCRCQAFLVAGDAAVTDPVCSLSPHRHLIDAAVADVERAAAAGSGAGAAAEEWTYRAAPASRALAAKG